MRIVLPMVILLGWLVTGCSTAARDKGGAPRQSSASASAPPNNAESVDYSPAAIERRTEAHARFAAGYLHDLHDEPEQAAEDYCMAAMADLSDEHLVTEASVRLLRLKKTDKALELLQAATAAPQAPAALFAQLGLVHALAGNQEAAIEANRTAVKLDPRLIAGYRNLAQVFMREGQRDEAIKVLDQASRQPDVAAHFLAELGELYLACDQGPPSDTVKSRALEAFRRAAEGDPAHPLVIEKLADGFAFLGETEAAGEQYVKLLRQYPALSGLREKLAGLYLQQKDYAKAAEQYRALVRLHPTNPQGHYFLGSIAAEEKKLEEAADHFRKVLQLNPNFEPAYYELASVYLRLSQPTNALATLEKASRKFKQNFVCEFYTALAYYGLKQYTNTIRHLVAAEVIARATDTNRLTHYLYFQLGAAYERNQQYDEAENHLKKCLELSPDDAEALNYLGYMWADRGVNLGAARELIEKAVKQEPENAAYLDSLGWVMFKLDQPGEALSYILKAIDHSESPDATLYDHLGDIYFALNQLEKAHEAWRQSLAIEPNESKEQIQKKLESSLSPPAVGEGSLQR